MVKRLLLILAFASLCGYASAVSPIRFGVKAGVNLSEIDFKAVPLRGERGDYVLSPSSGAKTGYYAGASSRVYLGFFHLLPEIVYSHNAYELGVGDRSIAPQTVALNSIQVPVLLETGLLFLKLQLGPVFNIWNEASVEGAGALDRQVLYARSSVGYMFGVGLNLGPLNLTARYNADFARPVQTITLDGGTAEVKTTLNTWMLGAGLRF